MQENAEAYEAAGFTGLTVHPLVTPEPPVSTDTDLSPGAIVGIILAAVVAAIVLLVVSALIINYW